MIQGLPADVCLKILHLLDHQNLATAQIVCRKWRSLASENALWSNLFRIRWGEGSAEFYDPQDSRSWKDMYAVQDRCDRAGLGLKIIREGIDYYLIHQGEIQQHLGKRRRTETGENHCSAAKTREFSTTDEPCAGILDKILFFIGDLENASLHAKKSKIL